LVEYVMSKWLESAEVQHRGCRCLGRACHFKLTDEDVTGFSSIVITSGALKAVTRALKNYPSNLPVQECGCLPLCNFLWSEKHRALYVANELKCVPLVVEAMKKFPQESFLQSNACGIMERLACHEELKVLLVKAGVRTQLAMALDNHEDGTGEDVDFIKNAAAAAMTQLLP